MQQTRTSIRFIVLASLLAVIPGLLACGGGSKTQSNPTVASSAATSTSPSNTLVAPSTISTSTNAPTSTSASGPNTPAPAAAASGPQFYVSATGSDSTGDGSATNPWATINYADSHIVPGATVHVGAGTYVLNSSTCITTRTSGTSTAPVTWISDVKWAAKINGNAACTSEMWHNLADYVNIYGFEITGNNAVSGSTNNGGPVVINNEGGYTDIAYNHIYNLTANYVAAIDNEGSYSNKTSENVHDNVFHDLHYSPVGGYGGGYAIYQATPGTVYNNLIYRVDTVAITTWHSGAPVKIYNNTIVGVKNTAIQVGTGDTGGVTNGSWDVSNNIVVNSVRGIIIELGSPGSIASSTTFRNNLVFGNGQDWQYYNDNTGANTTIQAAGLAVTGTMNADPKFVSPSTDDYHLAAGSPAIGAGLNLGIATDADATVRPNPPSIGAYE